MAIGEAWGSYEPNYNSYMTMTNDYQDDDGNFYSAGQKVDATDWDPNKVRSFKDATGADYYSDDITKQFDVWSQENLGGMSQYEFQLNGTGDQWADMTTSPELNRFYQAYGVNEGDRDSAMNFYNYYDGTEYNDAGEMTKLGEGINQLSEVDPYGNYADLTNITGGSANAISAFNRGFLEDREAVNGGISLDGKKNNDVSDDEVNLLNAQTFLSAVSSADKAGAREDRPTDGAVNKDAKLIYDSANDFPIDLRSDFEKQAPEPDFFTREIGRSYQEPTLDPDIRPRDVWSLDDITKLGVDSGQIELVEAMQDGQGTGVIDPTWMPAQNSPQAQPFQYTEGSLDNPYSDGGVNRESFNSALSLLGDDIRYAPNIETNEADGSFKGYVEGMPWTEDQAAPEASLGNQVINGRLTNPVDNEGRANIEGGFWDTPMFGATSDILGNEFTDEFIDQEMKEGQFSGPMFPGWTPTETLARENNWDSEDFRVFSNYLNNASLSYSSGNVNPKEEDRAIETVNQAKADREAGINRDPFTYNGAALNLFNPEAYKSTTSLANTPQETRAYLDSNPDYQALTGYLDANEDYQRLRDYANR